MSGKTLSRQIESPFVPIDLRKMGQRISERREELGLKRADVALALGYSDEKSYLRLEYGLRGCSLDKIHILAQILEVTVDYLLRGDDDQSRREDIMDKLKVLDGEHLTWISGVLDALMEHPT